MTTVVVKSTVMVRNYLTVKTFLFIYHLYELGRSVCRCGTTPQTPRPPDVTS